MQKNELSRKQKLTLVWLLQIFESDQFLVDSTISKSGIGSTLDSYLRIELPHGTVCDIYTCYTYNEPPPDGPLIKLRTTPVTCTVVGKQDHG